MQNADHVARALRQALIEYLRQRRDPIMNVSDVDYDNSMPPGFWVEIDSQTILVECKPWVSE